MSGNDDELQAHFDALRAEDQSGAPAFDEMVRDAAPAPVEPPPRRASRIGWWLAAASVLIAATALVARRNARADDHIDADAVLGDTAALRRLGSWSSPTDGLLRMSNTVVINPAAIDDAQPPATHRSPRSNEP